MVKFFTGRINFTLDKCCMVPVSFLFEGVNMLKIWRRCDSKGHNGANRGSDHRKASGLGHYQVQDRQGVRRNLDHLSCLGSRLVESLRGEVESFKGFIRQSHARKETTAFPLNRARFFNALTPQGAFFRVSPIKNISTLTRAYSEDTFLLRGKSLHNIDYRTLGF